MPPAVPPAVHSVSQHQWRVTGHCFCLSWWWLLIEGHGATLNADGEVELDAIIMDGRTLASGAVSSVKNIANPVSLARAVMEKVWDMWIWRLLRGTDLDPLHECFWLHTAYFCCAMNRSVLVIKESHFLLSLLLACLLPRKMSDCPRHADEQRRKPVCREHRRGGCPPWRAADRVWEERMGEAQDLRHWSGWRF